MSSSVIPSADELPKQYDHHAAQQRWFAMWEQRGYFHSEPDPQRKPFSIVIPPPNVTGALHLGHALNNSLQDIIVRFKRMQGFNALWMPGTDHAGIATQAVVEKRLKAEEGLDRHALGREKLVERIWEWKNQYETRILGQLKQMGSSCDWQRTRFTLDPVCARAVRHTFYSLFSEGLIYRGKRLVNWDTYLQTAVSDDEVYHTEVTGNFWHFRYPVIDPKPGEPTHVTIATTRPETMLGDTAVAVHPDPAAAFDQVEASLRERLSQAPAKQKADIQTQLDAVIERRGSMLAPLEQLRDMAADGRQLMLPLLDRPIPLVADGWAKPELGSGCVKITPAHDLNDYEVGLRQSLPMITILQPDGVLNDAAGPYAGLTMKKARQQVVEDLEALGLVEQIEDRLIELAHSDRSKTPIEPLLADQWFVKMDRLAQSAMDAVTSGQVKILPERYVKGYLDWLSEKRDWPVSRQLWWGHQIPIWYAPTASEDDLRKAFADRKDVTWTYDEDAQQWLICSQEDDLSEDAVAGHKLTREVDVLDTWFSSALWPHSTLGWPDKTPELEYYYPTSLLITSRDIITLWVARMVLTGLHNLGEIPFREVFIHPKILDGYGETMSKSKGNGVDPLDIIDKYGADALRFCIGQLTTDTQDLRMPVEFECPHCQALVPQTKKNRELPRVACQQCGSEFSTQWASKEADLALPRGVVVSDKFEDARNFCNKLWNASRFALLNLEGYEAGPVSQEELYVEDRWLLSRLSTVTTEVRTALESYHFSEACRALYKFAWDEFCSFYIEMVKSRLSDPEQRTVAQRVLAHALDVLLRLLHPMVPFITEEVWQLLGKFAPQRGLQTLTAPAESIMVADWPEADTAAQDAQIEQQFDLFQKVLTGIRDLRSRQNIPPAKSVQFCVKADSATVALLKPMQPYFATMPGAKAEATSWGAEVAPPEIHATYSLPGIDVYVDLAGLIDVEAEIAKQEKEQANLQKLIASKQGKLANENFTSRAPAEVVAGERASLAEAEQRLAAITAAIEQLQQQR